jgi:hypothetical protein
VKQALLRTSWRVCGALSLSLSLAAPSLAGSLFDGKDPRAHWRGWASERFPRAWVARAGALTLSGPIDDGWHRDGGYLLSRERYADFDLRFEFRTSPGANSGVMVRVDTGPGIEWPWQSGTEFQILDAAAASEPAAVADRSADLYALVAAIGARPHPAGQWNAGRIVACGRHLEHWLNGQRVVSVELDSPAFLQRVAASKFAPYPGFARSAEGHIALQDHGRPVWFRGLAIDRLGADCRKGQP